MKMIFLFATLLYVASLFAKSKERYSWNISLPGITHGLFDRDLAIGEYARIINNKVLVWCGEIFVKQKSKQKQIR